MGDRCSMKKSHVGKHCVIGNQVKLVNSIVMDHVTIQEKYGMVGAFPVLNSNRTA